MPKHTNGIHDGSSKRRQMKDQEFRSPNGLDANHGDTEEPGNPATTLASCNGALQRLAGIARYFESSFNQDINEVEGDYGTEMDKENEIQRLRGESEDTDPCRGWATGKPPTRNYRTQSWTRSI